MDVLDLAGRNALVLGVANHRSIAWGIARELSARGARLVLTYQGEKVATWKQQKGRAGFDLKGFRDVHPDLAAEFTTQGTPFRVLRRTRPKETQK